MSRTISISKLWSSIADEPFIIGRAEAKVTLPAPTETDKDATESVIVQFPMPVLDDSLILKADDESDTDYGIRMQEFFASVNACLPGYARSSYTEVPDGKGGFKYAYAAKLSGFVAALENGLYLALNGKAKKAAEAEGSIVKPMSPAKRLEFNRGLAGVYVASHSADPAILALVMEAVKTGANGLTALYDMLIAQGVVDGTV